MQVYYKYNSSWKVYSWLNYQACLYLASNNMTNESAARPKTGAGQRHYRQQEKEWVFVHEN